MPPANGRLFMSNASPYTWLNEGSVSELYAPPWYRQMLPRKVPTHMSPARSLVTNVNPEVMSGGVRSAHAVPLHTFTPPVANEYQGWPFRAMAMSLTQPSFIHVHVVPSNLAPPRTFEPIHTLSCASTSTASTLSQGFVHGIPLAVV